MQKLNFWKTKVQLHVYTTSPVYLYTAGYLFKNSPNSLRGNGSRKSTKKRLAVHK